ncbi:hypothetical protein P280DRAFT_492136 [Massarina eburnea CBS 473.64]|uniref:Linalool dehydratase/isomerase domain-containing protein n=1 Tax=Massarina eburnea CBS 473.64 TaxID=1395130 RepID=A0A6A6RRH7_9PLEO|nr:hypothetical protein P280DRAFT_492136 [Massarina eburnea CBS 473.64]
MTTTDVASRPKLSTSISQKLDMSRFDNHPKLTREQAGHIRHFHNIASLPGGEWAHMGTQEPGQEWDTAYRYQLATMTYAAGAAHYHHLPLMRDMFKDLLLNQINKMLRREVWGYWYMTSQSGVKVDPDLKELRKPWADPVCKENIMYSGHLLLMISLYTMLFADDRFDKEDSIVFDWNPIFWGMGPEKYSYTRLSLQDAIVQEMERENWLGVCCEPNLVFIVCNQFPLLAMRYNDAIDGTHTFDSILPKYQAAWAKKNGFVGNNGLFRAFVTRRRDQAIDSEDISHTVWAMAFMSWNQDFVKSLYPATGQGFLQRMSDRINLNPQPVANKIRELVQSEDLDPNAVDTLERARKMVQGQPLLRKPFLSPTFGYVAQWMSEVGNAGDLDALLRHADAYLRPSWERGGLYYARGDVNWDREGNFTGGDPYTGNGGIGYARLNVKDGQKKMWEAPWTKEDVESRPWVGGFGLGSGVDCLRSVWDEEVGAVVVSLKTWDGRKEDVKMDVNSLPEGEWAVYVDGELVRIVDVVEGKVLSLDVEVNGEVVDVAVVRV